MRTIPEAVEDIKSILNNIERTENCDGETLVDINELADEILIISAYKGKKQTNADRIRSMSDEELAELLYSIQNLEDKVKFCKNKIECDNILDSGKEIPDNMCKQCLVDWLQSEVEEQHETQINQVRKKNCV